MGKQTKGDEDGAKRVKV